MTTPSMRDTLLAAIERLMDDTTYPLPAPTVISPQRAAWARNRLGLADDAPIPAADYWSLLAAEIREARS